MLLLLLKREIGRMWRRKKGSDRSMRKTADPWWSLWLRSWPLHWWLKSLALNTFFLHELLKFTQRQGCTLFCCLREEVPPAAPCPVDKGVPINGFQLYRSTFKFFCRDFFFLHNSQTSKSLTRPPRLLFQYQQHRLETKSLNYETPSSHEVR